MITDGRHGVPSARRPFGIAGAKRVNRCSRQDCSGLHRRRTPLGGWDPRAAIANDEHAATDLVVVGCWQVLRRFHHLHNRRCLAAHRQGIWPERRATRNGECCYANWYFDWRDRFGWSFGSSWPQAGVCVRDGIVLYVFGADRIHTKLRMAGGLLVWNGTCSGCDYPTAHLVISESTPTHCRGSLVLGAFAFQAVGALAGTVIGYLICLDRSEQGWRWMYASAIVPGILVSIGRFFVTESPQWLASQGRDREAEQEILRLLARSPPYPNHVELTSGRRSVGKLEARAGSYRQLFEPANLRATILASVPWLLQDLSTYGIGIFTPTILAVTIGHKREHAQTIADLVVNDVIAAKGAAFIDCLLLLGIIFAVMLADRIGRIRLQIIGFIGCAAGLYMASQSTGYEGHPKMLLLFAGFMLFNFMTNLGPNAQTYLIAGEVFPTAIRGKGAGVAASLAKVGACTTAFLFPILLAGMAPQNCCTFWSERRSSARS